MHLTVCIRSPWPVIPLCQTIHPTRHRAKLLREVLHPVTTTVGPSRRIPQVGQNALHPSVQLRPFSPLPALQGRGG